MAKSCKLIIGITLDRRILERIFGKRFVQFFSYGLVFCCFPSSLLFVVLVGEIDVYTCVRVRFEIRKTFFRLVNRYSFFSVKEYVIYYDRLECYCKGIGYWVVGIYYLPTRTIAVVFLHISFTKLKCASNSYTRERRWFDKCTYGIWIPGYWLWPVGAGILTFQRINTTRLPYTYH